MIFIIVQLIVIIKLLSWLRNQYIICTKLCSNNGKHFLENNIRDKINDNDIFIKNGRHNQLIKGNYLNQSYLPKIIDRMTRDKNYKKEELIVQKLNETLNGQLEVRTPIGRIDILSDTQLIEVKEYKCWTGSIIWTLLSW